MDIERLAGTKLGSYEIESLLGRGGMSVVYKARQVNLDRPVALKILPPTLSSDASFVKRFKREARAVAKLSHSNIIQIFDITEDKDLHFFSMEYVEGKTLDKVLEEKGKLEPGEAVKIISQAARALEHAHRSNIIHRDVKPSNIILDNYGNVKVMDFGLARAADDRSKVTQSGTLIGTLGYMSPEQCRGEELDFRTDIYSLGVVLYEMLTGTAPFDAPNEAAMIHKIINEDPAEAKKLDPNIPADIDATVSRAISKEREKRYASISEFLGNIQQLERSTLSMSVAGGKSIPSIAVLPFVNMSADPDQEYFCDGLAEEIINALTHIGNLKVIARTSAFSFRGKDVDVRDIGRKLDVGTVLEGSVRKAGNRLRITAQLVDTSGGHHLWSERYDRELDDVFAIQDEITLAIVDNLKPRLLQGEKDRLVRRQPVDLEAYNLYLEGNYFASKVWPGAIAKAIDCFEQAIEKAPDYALPYAALAGAYLGNYFYNPLPPKEVFPIAKESVLKALRIDDTVAEAHVYFANILSNYDWKWEQAEKEYKKALELNPADALVHQWYSRHLMVVGRTEESIDQILHACSLDPLSIIVNLWRGSVALIVDDNDTAIELGEKMIQLDPNTVYARSVIGWAYLQKSMHEEAVTAFEKEKEIWSDVNPILDTWIGAGYGMMGRKEKTKRILDSFHELESKMYIPPSCFASLYFAVGNNDEGFRWLDKAYEERDNLLALLKLFGVFDPVRSDPRYKTLITKMNLDK